MCEVSPTGFGQCVCAPEEHCKGHKKEVTKFQPHLFQLFLFYGSVILLYSVTMLKIVFFLNRYVVLMAKPTPVIVNYTEQHAFRVIQ